MANLAVQIVKISSIISVYMCTEKGGVHIYKGKYTKQGKNKGKKKIL